MDVLSGELPDNTVMIFITGADHRFSFILDKWKQHLKRWHYEYLIYDLGNLGSGIKGFEETDRNFKGKGFYNSIDGKWKSTGLWKTRILSDAITRTTDNIIYLDCDAYVLQPFEIDWSFDIGVVRREKFGEKDPTKVYLRGKYNAGVLFLKNNSAIKNFITEWAKEEKNTKNDQKALHNEIQKKKVSVKEFPCIYNQNIVHANTIIHHETGGIKNGRIIR